MCQPTCSKSDNSNRCCTFEDLHASVYIEVTLKVCWGGGGIPSQTGTNQLCGSLPDDLGLHEDSVVC
jgi:hypothetical protein